MHRDLLAYVDDLRKRRTEEEFEMYVNCVVKANIDNEEVLRRLGVDITIAVK